MGDSDRMINCSSYHVINVNNHSVFTSAPQTYASTSTWPTGLDHHKNSFGLSTLNHVHSLNRVKGIFM